MEYLRVTKENLKDEHICCGFSDKKCSQGYEEKKDWLAQRIDSGYAFLKLPVRGKVFIEYSPAETAMAPITAPGYTVINCFWVSGRFKGQGHGKALLEKCIAVSKDTNGILAVVGKKKLPFLSDKKFLMHRGFSVVDTALEKFELLCLKFDPSAPDPRFTDSAKTGKTEYTEDVVVYYSNRCPFTPYYAGTVLKEIAENRGLSFRAVHTATQTEAEQLPAPASIYSVFYKGTFLTQEILTEKKFDKLTGV
ncbi:MAG: GNAT family N-acetyltransferase [Spirochaetia bacterium]